MLFCKKCGGALHLFETNDAQLCRSCEKKAVPPHATMLATNDPLSKAVFSSENNRLTLKSPEGWVLWSGSIHKEISLQEILKQARRIYEMRSKRKKPGPVAIKQ